MHKSKELVCVIILLLFLFGMSIVSAEEKSVNSTDQPVTNNTEAKPKGCAVITVKNSLNESLEGAYINVYLYSEKDTRKDLQDRGPDVIVKTNKVGVAKINGLRDGNYAAMVDFKGQENLDIFPIKNGNQKEDIVKYLFPYGHKYLINCSVITPGRTTTSTEERKYDEDFTWKLENSQDGQPIAYIDVDGKKQLPSPISINRVAGDHTIKAYYLPRGKVHIEISFFGPGHADFDSAVTGYHFMTLSHFYEAEFDTFQGDIINATVEGKVKCSWPVNKANNSFTV